MTTILLFSAFVSLFLFGNCLDLPDIEIPSIDDIGAIKEKCDSVGGNGTYERLKEARTAATTCLQGLIDFDQVKNELEEAKKTGSMDEVFGKYCKKRPEVHSCVENFKTQLKLCLDSGEQNSLNITSEILKQLGDFVCFRDGDRIAMFVAEGGIECLKSRTEGIQNCINSTFKVDSSLISSNSIPNLLIDEKKCSDLGKLQTCVVEDLEKCKDSTPANIVDALFKFIKRAACPETQNKRHIHKVFKRNVKVATKLVEYTEVKKKLFKIFREKCAENAPEETFDALSTSYENAGDCLSTVKKTAGLFEASAKVKLAIEKCVDGLVEEAATCLPDEEKYFPEFYMNIIYSIVDLLYERKDHLTSLGGEFASCSKNLQHGTNKNYIASCLKSRSDESDLSKDAVCRYYDGTKDCIIKKLNKHCKQQVELKEVVGEFFDTILESCT